MLNIFNRCQQFEVEFLVILGNLINLTYSWKLTYLRNFIKLQKKCVAQLTTSILLTQVRKPPYISKPYAVTNDAEKELHLSAPRSSVFISILTCRCILIGGHDNSHGMRTLTFLVQGCQLVPVSRVLGLRHHSRKVSSTLTLNRLTTEGKQQEFIVVA